MDQKKVIESLIRIAENQQKIIRKLAQNAELTQSLEPKQNLTTHEAGTIMAALPPAVKAAVETLEVHGSQVVVKFHPGKASDQVFNAIVNVVNNLQQTNTLPSSGYKVVEAQ
jgi:hypothetical protein